MKLLKLVKLTIIMAALSQTLTGCYDSNTGEQTNDITTAPKVSQSELDQMKKYEVIRVVDGDTFVISTGQRVRLIGVDTPETVKEDVSEEYYGREASDYAKKMLTGATVYMQKDTSNTDKHGRLLRYVYLSDGAFFNLLLVREGYADVMIREPDDEYEGVLYDALDYAREKKLGMWK